jgi:hypothetical protein
VDEFTGVMAVGTGWVAILMPVLLVWVIFYYSTKSGQRQICGYGFYF